MHGNRVVVDADGDALADKSAVIKSVYVDGSEDRIVVGLNAAGEFTALPGIAELRAGTARFVLTVDDAEGEWRSEPIECLPDQVVDLGKIVIAPKAGSTGQTEETRDDEE
jgi:hypothetical protein